VRLQHFCLDQTGLNAENESSGAIFPPNFGTHDALASSAVEILNLRAKERVMSKEMSSQVFEEVFGNLKKATEANLKMQQEMFRQWTALWPGVPTPQTMWMDKMREFQKQWVETVSDVARKHRETFDRQYQAALESFEAALRVSESTSPEEARRRTEQLCRKTLDCLREMSETQIREFQEAATKWTELLAQTGK
jgi:hypothetical protein